MGKIFVLFTYTLVLLLNPLILDALETQKEITQYKLSNWHLENGLPQVSVLAIEQTNDGYLWLGTLGGLVRFDGVRFKVFDRKNTPQLQDNKITTLFETSSGELIIGTSEGGLHSYYDGRFSKFSSEGQKYLKKISVILEDRQKNLWIGTLNNGLVCINGGNYTRYTSSDGLPSNRIRALTLDSQSAIWIATAKGVAKINPNGTFPILASSSKVINSELTALRHTKEEEIWVGSYSGICNLGKFDGKPNLYKDYLLKQTAKCILDDSNQNLWIGTDGGGLLRLREEKFESLTTANGLASNFIQSLYEDRQKNLWIGSLDGGLHQLKDTNILTVSTKEGLSHNVISSILEDRFGNVWIGTKGGGINRINKNRIDLVLNSTNGLSNDFVHSVAEDTAGYIWVGTNSGLYRFRNGQIKRFTTRDGLTDNQILKLAKHSDGTVWIVTREKVNRFQNGTFTEYHPPHKLTKKIRYIREGRSGVIWMFIANGGVCSVNGNQTTSYDESNGLVQNEVETMYEDKDGVLYFGTRGGMSRVENGKITNFTTQSGLNENQVRHIMEDRFGYLWLSGRLGIYRIAKQKLDDYAAGRVKEVHPMIFDQSDGIEQPWCEKGIVTRDGKLWFTSYKGLVIIDPVKVGAHTEVPPQAIIETMNVNGSPVDIFPVEGTLTLPPGKKRIEFVYTAPTFYKPKKVKFHLKLRGYEKNWVDVGTKRSTVYTGLGPGRYTFEVEASDPQGTWSKDSATLTFYIKPYFYQTIWFILSMAVAFILITVFSYRIRIRQLRSREKTLSSLVESRTQDLKERNHQLEETHEKLRQSNAMIEAKNRQLENQSEKLKEMDQIKSRFFANISHEFRTPLTLIMGPLERRLFESRDEQDLDELEMMLRNSRRLLSLINQLLDLAKLESGGIRLQASKQDIVPFAKGIGRSFDSLISQQQLTLDVESKSESILIYFDGEKIENIFSNLLSNAIKFTPSGGAITFTLERRPNNNAQFPQGFIEIVIKDTGTGIPEDQLPYIFNHFYQAEGVFSHYQASKGSGIGLALVKELVTLHGGDISVRSRLREGTEFTVRLPLGDSHLKPEEIVQDIQYEMPDKTDCELPKPEGSDKQSPAGGDGDKNLILVVEDNPDVRLYIRKALEPMYKVKGAVNGKAGIDLARQIIPDLIISDVMMPLADGYTLCETLKKDVKTSHIPIILLTAKAAEDNVVTGLETGADDYITKPFSTRILLTRIKNLIQVRRRLQQNIQQELILQPEEIAVSSIDQTFIKELKQALEKNLADAEFGVNDLAEALFMSRATLNRKIKAISGESTNRFIQSFRLKRAAKLLEENFGNVTDVAFAVGFSSSAYFTRCFKEKFHRLPSEN